MGLTVWIISGALCFAWLFFWPCHKRVIQTELFHEPCVWYTVVMCLTDWIISEQCSNTFVFDLFDEPKWLNILAEWWLTDILIFKIFIASLLPNQRLIQNSFPEEQKDFKPPMSDSYHWGRRGEAKWHWSL